jgi:hypothetical protein
MESRVYLTPPGYQALLTDGFDHASVKLPIVSRAMARGQRAEQFFCGCTACEWITSRRKP